MGKRTFQGCFFSPTGTVWRGFISWIGRSPHLPVLSISCVFEIREQRLLSACTVLGAFVFKVFFPLTDGSVIVFVMLCYHNVESGCCSQDLIYGLCPERGSLIPSCHLLSRLEMLPAGRWKPPYKSSSAFFGWFGSWERTPGPSLSAKAPQTHGMRRSADKSNADHVCLCESAAELTATIWTFCVLLLESCAVYRNVVKWIMFLKAQLHWSCC